MPIVTIQAVVAESEQKYAADTIQKLADSLGEIFESDPSSTWIKMIYLDRNQYAENDAVIEEAVRPTFVDILKRYLPDHDSLSTEAQRVADAVAQILTRPRENVHIVYLPPGMGRVAFGGNLLREQNNGK